MPDVPKRRDAVNVHLRPSVRPAFAAGKTTVDCAALDGWRQLSAAFDRRAITTARRECDCSVDGRCHGGHGGAGPCQPVRSDAASMRPASRRQDSVWSVRLATIEPAARRRTLAPGGSATASVDHTRDAGAWQADTFRMRRCTARPAARWCRSLGVRSACTPRSGPTPPASRSASCGGQLPALGRYSSLGCTQAMMPCVLPARFRSLQPSWVVVDNRRDAGARGAGRS
jgi:hypothetical protein